MLYVSNLFLKMKNQFLLLLAVIFFAEYPQMVQADSLENKPAPICSLGSLNNTQHYDLEQFKGKVLYVDFWASWCGPCAQSIPFMNTLHQDLEAKGLQIIAINMDEQPDDAISFLKNKPAEFIVATDTNGQCAKSFDVQTMPSTYLIDRKGRVRLIHFGYRPAVAEELRVNVEALLRE